MARSTDKTLRNQVMYQIFVRNFSEEGTFSAVRERLSEIKDLGVDIIWLMPIHPVGKVKRKGSLGSPYAISDYRAVNPEFGTLDDFKALVDDIHRHQMKCIIDVVYNHTSPDSVLSKEHPDWFYHKEDGSFGNRVGDWSDIIDLDYSNKELWSYQIETLKMWAEIVDGFRCDVAPLIPLEFWLKARKEVETVRKGAIWLSESVEPEFIRYLRSQGMTALSDSEIYNAFDICYDYDIYREFKDYLSSKGSLSRYADAMMRQEYIYPDNFVKLRFLENHDQTRAAFLIPDERTLRNWTAFLYFQKGLTLIYAGQEYGAAHLPSLFDKDTVDFIKRIDLSAQMKRLYSMKKDPLFTDSVYNVRAAGESFIVASHQKGERKAVGVFSLKGESGLVEVDLPDGFYENILTGEETEVFRCGVQSHGEPIVLLVKR